jgi:hypothetical protein
MNNDTDMIINTPVTEYNIILIFIDVSFSSMFVVEDASVVDDINSRESEKN